MHYILLWPLGGLTFLGHTSSPGRDLFVAIAGPLTHIPQVLVWVGILALSAHIVHYPWQHDFHVPDIRTHFWLAVCSGAAQVRSPFLKNQLWSSSSSLLLAPSILIFYLSRHSHTQRQF